MYMYVRVYTWAWRRDAFQTPRRQRRVLLSSLSRFKHCCCYCYCLCGAEASLHMLENEQKISRVKLQLTNKFKELISLINIYMYLCTSHIILSELQLNTSVDKQKVK